METTTIEIDLDIKKAIELGRESFKETPNVILRRLLNVENSQSNFIQKTQTNESIPVEIDNEGWEGDGAFLPNGTKCKLIYKSREYYAHIENQKWVVQGIKCKSPTNAATLACGLHQNSPVNGWKKWYVKRPADTRYVHLNPLRNNMRKTRKRTRKVNG